MHLDISVDCPVHDSAHVRKLSNLFDVPPQDRASEQFTAEVPGLDESWDIGVIVGPSGSGKTTIARAAFGSNLYQPTPWPEQCAVVDCFGDQPIERITRVLTAVGFSSVPSWVKPYSVLSNGEKFRCELARALLSGTSPVVFDEYSSVVDRTMAKIASAATSKAIRTQTAIGIAERFVAVTCHHDVVEWLEPDWVLDMGSQSRLCLKTLDAHDGSERLWPLGAAAKSGSVDPLSRGNDADEAILSRLRWAGFDPPASLSPLDGSTEPDFGTTPRSRIESGPSGASRVLRQSLARGRLRRPWITLQCRRVERAIWSLFKRHHYLSSSLHPSASCYLASIDSRPAAFTAVLCHPHATKPGWREHRTVCLPEFQGIGIGSAISEFVASLYVAGGRPYYSSTAHPAMIAHRMRSPLWRMYRKPGVSRPPGRTSGVLARPAGSSRITAGFEYVGPARPLDAARFGL